jgi:hypothetical protein
VGIGDVVKRRRMRQPVPGSFRVVEVVTVGGSDGGVLAVVDGVLTAEGVGPAAATLRRSFPVEALPSVGDELPVTVDRTHPSRFVLAIPDTTSRLLAGRAAAEVLAEAAATGTVAGLDEATATPAQRARLLAAAGSTAFGTELATALSRFHGVPIAITLHDREYPPDPARLPAGLLTATEAARIKATGQPALAEVLDVHEVPPVPGLPPDQLTVLLTLRVHRPHGGTFQVRVNSAYRDHHRRDLIAVPGRTLPVRLDPTAPDRVAIDSAAIDEAVTAGRWPLPS